MSLRPAPLLLLGLTVLAGTAHASGLFKTLTPEQHHEKFCAAAAELEWEQGAPDAAVQVWHDCIQEADHRGYSELGPPLRGQLILAQTQRDYGRRESADPLLYSRIVLATAAQNPDARFPSELLDQHWHRLLVDNDARQNLASVRTVTLRWLNKSELPPALYDQLEQNVRRYVGDRGFKVNSPDTAQAGEAAIIVMLEGSIQNGEPIVDGPLTFHVVEAAIESMPVKFKQRNTRGAPVKAFHQAQAIRVEEAHAEVLEQVSLGFAQQLQYRVITEVFRSFEIPPP